MEHAESEPGFTPATPGVTATVAAVLAALLVAQLTLTGSLTSLGREFWLDEMFTEVVVTDPSLSRAMRGLAGGVDSNPPGLYLLLRGFAALAGKADEVTLRCFALASVWLALVGLYASVRRS